MREFEVGDKVRVNEKGVKFINGHGVGRVDETCTGVVEALSPMLVRVRLDCEPRTCDSDPWAFVDSELELIAPAESSTPATTNAVIRIIGAETDNTRFLRTGDVVEVRLVFDEGSAYSVTMTIDQFNEVHRIINEGSEK